jgi:signal transduction histidine kinase/CheY-like chemotaxis protein
LHPEERLAKLILTTVIALGSWGPPFFFIFWFLGFKGPAVITGTTSAMLWLSPVLLRRSRSVWLVGNYIAGLFWFAITAIVWFAGGARSPVMITLIAVAMLAWLLTQSRWRVAWLALTSCSILGFLLIEKLGISNPNTIPPDVVIYLQPVILLAVIAISLSVVWFFELLKKDAMAVLAESNLAIKKNQKELVRLTHDLSTARDEAVRASRTKSSFLANMSHELRTPLNAIIGYSELLLEDAEDSGDEESAEDLGKIHSAGEHLLALISDILDLSKIEAGRIEIHPEEFTLSSFLSDVSVTVDPLAAKKNNAFELVFDESLGGMFSDQTRVRQILLNLLSNACKFTHEGTVSLTVEAFAYEERDWLRFAVKDTGIGMTPKQLDKIFDAFTQADHLTSRTYGGTGLGLAISRKLAQMLGGEIHAASEEGEGSTFTLEIPRRVATDNDPLSERKHKPSDLSAFIEDRPLVLVIDDDHNVHELLLRVLRKANYNVVTAFDGIEGLRLAKELRPAVITLDALMPKMSGWDVLTTLKSTPSLADIPVIMISIADEVERGFALGIAEYMTKPIDRGRLLSILQSFRDQQEVTSVMVVEDDDSTRELIVRLLTRNGWKTTEAINGQEALDLLETERPDLIVSDLMMPVMDGFAFIEALGEDAELSEIPVVVLTAMELAPEDMTRLQQRIESVLQKGAYPLRELETRLLTLLEGHV